MARLEGRWACLLVLAVAGLAAGYAFYRDEVRHHGLKSFDFKADRVVVLNPAEWAQANQEMLSAAWAEARRSPRLRDVRFIVYADRRNLLDQFGRPPQMDVYLGNVFFPAEDLAALRRLASLTEARAAFPAVYLDWDWTYRRGLHHLVKDELSAPAFPPGSDWAAALNWVLFQMLPPPPWALRHVQAFGPDWSADPRLERVEPRPPAKAGPPAVSPARPRLELVYAFHFDRPWTEATLRDIHTAWAENEGVTCQVSEDGQAWRRVYADFGGARRRLLALRLAPSRPESTALWLKYVLEIKGPSSRGLDDLRGASLTFLDLAVQTRRP
jgi:hypothetical protein